MNGLQSHVNSHQEMMGTPVLWMLMLWSGVRGVASCSDKPIISVSKPSKVLISCPSISTDSSEISYLLLFNGNSICQIHLTKVTARPEDSFLSSFTQQHHSGRVSFSTQTELTADNSGEFVCRMEQSYPPPYRQDCHRTTVNVSAEPTINTTVPSANQSCPDRSPLIPEVVMWAGSGVLLVYSITITCITVAVWRKKLKLDDEDTKIYANTRAPGIRKPYKC